MEGGADLPRINGVRHLDRHGGGFYHPAFCRHGRATADRDLWTITNTSGRTRSEQTAKALWNSLKHTTPISFGEQRPGARKLWPHIAASAHKTDSALFGA